VPKSNPINASYSNLTDYTQNLITDSSRRFVQAVSQTEGLIMRHNRNYKSLNKEVIRNSLRR
jgi:hypothetical protein